LVAPTSPRDPKELLKDQIVKLEKVIDCMKQCRHSPAQGCDELRAEVREKESELEDLGCWRRILIRNRRPVKKLTEVALHSNAVGMQ
jgi:hypothetical protein